MMNWKQMMGSQKPLPWLEENSDKLGNKSQMGRTSDSTSATNLINPRKVKVMRSLLKPRVYNVMSVKDWVISELNVLPFSRNRRRV
jgi:hypothetical protein